MISIAAFSPDKKKKDEKRRKIDMVNLKDRFGAFINSHHRCPTGFVGMLVADKMVRQHQPEHAWAVSELALQPADEVLEIGFGAGRAIELMVEQVTQGHIYGIDLSPTMVRAAGRRNAQVVREGRVILQHGDVSALPFADQQFDKILSIHSIYFWSDIPLIMQGLFRILKPGGKLFLALATTWINAEGEKIVDPLQTTLEEQIIPGMLQHGFTAAYLAQGPDNRQFNNVAVVGEK
jgi:ubiquinone/menaquinone biosynthesis C-methylase UbiE